MPISFPVNAIDGQTHTMGGIVYFYDAADDKWIAQSSIPTAAANTTLPDVYLGSMSFDANTGDISSTRNDLFVTTTNLDGRYLPLSGGTLTGPLIVDSDLTVTGNTTTENLTANNGTVETLTANNGTFETLVSNNTTTETLTVNGTTTFSNTVVFNSNAVFNGTLSANAVDIAMGDLTDADTTGVVAGQYLAWDGVNFVPTTPATGTDTFVAASAFDANTRVLALTMSDATTLTTTIPLQALPAETVTSLAVAGNILTYTDELGANTAIDLSLYVDDTNLARLVSGTVAANGMATFSRDDASTFDVDFSALFDDTNLSRITSGSVAGSILTLTRDDATSFNIDLSSLTSTTTLDALTDTANVALATAGQVLAYDGAAWAPSTLPTGTTDTVISALNFDPATRVLTAGISDGSSLTTTIPDETVTALSLATNILTYTDEAGVATNIDLSLYLDDTNLARLVSGTVAANGMATFTRDDATTFDVDFSALVGGSDTFTTAVAMDANSLVTFTRSDSNTYTLDLGSLDNRVVVGNTSPVSPVEGDLWYDELSSRTFVYVDSAASWIDASPTTTDTNTFTNTAVLDSNNLVTFTRNDGSDYTLDLASLAGGGSIPDATAPWQQLAWDNVNSQWIPAVPLATQLLNQATTASNEAIIQTSAGTLGTGMMAYNGTDGRIEVQTEGDVAANGSDWKQVAYVDDLPSIPNGTAFGQLLWWTGATWATSADINSGFEFDGYTGTMISDQSFKLYDGPITNGLVNFRKSHNHIQATADRYIGTDGIPGTMVTNTKLELEISNNAQITWDPTIEWVDGFQPDLPNGTHVIDFVARGGAGVFARVWGAASFKQANAWNSLGSTTVSNNSMNVVPLGFANIGEVFAQATEGMIVVREGTEYVSSIIPSDAVASFPATFPIHKGGSLQASVTFTAATDTIFDVTIGSADEVKIYYR